MNFGSSLPEIPTLPPPKENERTRKVNLWFKIGMIVYMLGLSVPLFLLTRNPNDFSNYWCEWQERISGGCNKQLNALIIIVAMFLPILLSKVIVEKITGIKIKFPPRKKRW